MPTTPTPLRRQQALIGLQIALSVPLQLAFYWLGQTHLPLSLPESDTMGDRLAFVFQWNVWGALTLLAMILTIAGIRPLFADVINGNDSAERLSTQVRIQRNTLEQLILMVMGHLALATLVPFERLIVIPVLSLMFVVFRLFFWAGYSYAPHFRTFGFVGTFYPNIAVLIYVGYLLIT